MESKNMGIEINNKKLSITDKQLVLIDICGRLPYGVIVQIPELFYSTKTIDVELDAIFKVNADFHFTNDYGYLLENIKPYLRPMSSMTEEEDKEFALLQVNVHRADILYAIDCTKVVEWLNKHHFDYRGLIGKGLAIEVTKEYNPYEKE